MKIDISIPPGSSIIKNHIPKNIKERMVGFAMLASLILSGEASALLPQNATSDGEFGDEYSQSCNFSRTTIGGIEGLITATHCLGSSSGKDIAFFHGKSLQNPQISEKFNQVPSIKTSEISDQDILGKEIYIPGYLEDDAGNRYFFRLRGVVQKENKSPLFFIQTDKKDLINAKKILKKDSSVWKGLSGSAVILTSDDSLVGIVSRAKVQGESIYFSGPENIQSIKTHLQSEK